MSRGQMRRSFGCDALSTATVLCRQLCAGARPPPTVDRYVGLWGRRCDAAFRWPYAVYGGGASSGLLARRRSFGSCSASRFNSRRRLSPRGALFNGGRAAMNVCASCVVYVRGLGAFRVQHRRLSGSRLKLNLRCCRCTQTL